MKLIRSTPWKLAYATIDLKDVTIVLLDGTTPTPNTISVKLGEGNLTYTENRNIEYRLDRGKLDEVRVGDEAPMDVSLDAVWEFLKASSGQPASIEDFMKFRGAAATNKSTDTDPCGPKSIDIRIQNKPGCGTGTEKEWITIPDFNYDTIAHDLREGTLTFAGRANATDASIVRLAVST